MGQRQNREVDGHNTYNYSNLQRQSKQGRTCQGKVVIGTNYAANKAIRDEALTPQWIKIRILKCIYSIIQNRYKVT